MEGSKLRGIILGDLHFGLNYKGLDYNIKIFRKVNKIILETTKGRKVDFIVFLGDIFHYTGLSIDNMMYFLEVIKYICYDVECSTYVIEGNHDRKTTGKGKKLIFDFYEKIGYENIHFIRRIEIVKFKKQKTIFLFIPNGIDETNNISTQEELERESKKILNNNKGWKIIVFSHLNVKGAKVMEDVTIEKYEMSVPSVLIKSKKVKKIFNGHLHIPQVIGKIEMPGSIETLRFGEGSERFFIEISI